jgi:hypothetical protein
MSSQDHHGERSMEAADMALVRLGDSQVTGLAAYDQASRTPLDALMAAEEGEGADVDGIRLQTYRRLIAFFFRHGPRPVSVAKNVWAVAAHFHPQLLRGGPTLEAVAREFGETRAAASARGKKVINQTIDAANGRPGSYRAPHQKSAETVERSREAARGNRNRKEAARRKRAEAGKQEIFEAPRKRADRSRKGQK